MEPKKSKPRAKTLKVHIPTIYLKNILDASTEHALRMNSVQSYRDQPKPDEMRATLRPAYFVLSMLLNQQEKTIIEPEDLSALTVENHASCGYVRVSFMNHKTKQNYKVTFYPQDYNTIFLRTYTAPVRDASIPADELAIRAII